MSVTIVVPAPIPDVADFPVAAGASTCSEAIRACSVAVSGVVTETRSSGLPGDWQGQASDAAGYALARFSRDADAVLAALEVAQVGLDVFHHQMDTLRSTHSALSSDQLVYSVQQTSLERRIHALAAGAEPPQISALQDEAARLSRRHDTITDDLATMWRGVAAAEKRLIGVMQSVDTESEAEHAASAPGRVDPAALQTRLRALAGDPVAVRNWWSHLNYAQREALLAADPHLVGNTNGVPVVDRDGANRAGLDRDLAHLQTLQNDGVALSSAQQRELKNALAAQAALHRADTTLSPVTGQAPGGFLLAYDPTAFDGDGSAAVAIGNPDTAERTAVSVPGFSNDMAKMDSITKDAGNVYGQASLDDPGHTVSTIAWMGYDAPNLDASGLVGKLRDLADVGGVATEGQAERGGLELSDFVGGLRATHHGAPTDLTVIGHSYGSTTVAHAATDGMHADNVVLIGSPGAGNGVDDVAGLHTAPGHVFVGAAENDPVTWLGGDDPVGLGHDPSQAAFGATRFSVDSGPTFHVNSIGTGLQTHGSYYDPGSTSLNNISHIVDGQRPDVVPGRTDSARHHLTSWAEGEVKYQVNQHVVKPIVGAGTDVVHGAEKGYGVVSGGIKSGLHKLGL